MANEAVNEMTMSELIEYYNTLATTQGVAAVESFKSLAEARDEVARLEAKVDGVPYEGGVPAGTGETAPKEGSSDPQKYNTSGKRGPNQGIGAYSKERILAGKTNPEILAEIAVKFPGAKTSSACIAYYRSALKKGPAQPDPASLRAKAAELIAQAEAVEKAIADKVAADKAAAEKAEADKLAAEEAAAAKTEANAEVPA